jgi:regulator of protease activity HflC (stomatin/prohibitin superfamily)
MFSFIMLLAIIALVVIFAFPKIVNQDGDELDFDVTKRWIKLVSFALIIFSIFGSAYYSVPAGYRGVLLNFGAVKGVMGEGVQFVMPFVQKVELMEVRTQKEEARAAAASKDLQNVSTTVAINYHLNPLQVGNLYKNVGLDFASRIIDPATQETVKAVVANYTAEELIRLRSKIKTEIDTMLTERLKAYDIVVENNGVSLTNFEFSQDFNRAIEQKQVAQQSAEKSKYELQKAEIDAKTAIARAEGEARSNKIKAEALNQNGGSKVLAREWIEKWDGHLPQVSSSGNMMFNIDSLIKEANSK